MRMPHVDDRVRLLGPIPNTALAPGQVGVVCSEWAGGGGRTLFEVEFHSRPDGDPAHDDVTRRLLTLEQIALLEQFGGDADDGAAARPD